ncbi:hypothetical protein SAMN05216389_106101 [Oceanobacillus limi]|uniref:Uncharacterized protein n=1 Tax=Oceanobacillus limi TaxID=930131 RepID=A0A1I0CAT2_9BACI|nr:hypothetical protein [Oceanobacillus limi]SET16003.1 hypothetical protein SAMN05216389_106101 [Oceanobacillus limi]
MGYILPIQHHEYHDYQKRIIKEKRNPYVIEKPFKTILESQYEELKKDNYSSQASTKESRIIYADLTGTGENVNVKV